MLCVVRSKGLEGVRLWAKHKSENVCANEAPRIRKQGASITKQEGRSESENNADTSLKRRGANQKAGRCKAESRETTERVFTSA